MTNADEPANGGIGAEPLHPRDNTYFFGHTQAERALLESYRGGRIPHAWLIGGPPGIGKATLAYRMARFVLAYPDPVSAEVKSATNLAVPDDHPVIRRVSAQAHTDLLVLERTATESGALRSVITVNEVRRTVSFFGSTAGEGGWRVCIVDTADELQYPQASNALLKVLEEPPPRALFLVVSHAPGRLLATIRSRCRRLLLRPLGEATVAMAAAKSLGRDASDAQVGDAAAAAGGSVAQAVAILGGENLALREQVLQQLARLPAIDPHALQSLGEALARADDGGFSAFVDTLRDWLSKQLAFTPQDKARLARVAEVWEKLNRTARDVEVFNLDRRPMVFSSFGLLADTVRR
jgi:DNA polymerase-3 subunit delta'